MPSHAPNLDARKTSVALLVSIALHAALLVALSIVGIVEPPGVPRESFPLYLGPIGAPGGLGASRGGGAPAAAAGGEAVAKVQTKAAPEPEPIRVTEDTEVAPRKPKPPTPIANKQPPKPPSATSPAIAPSSGQGAASAGTGTVASANGVSGGSGAGGAGAGGTASYEQALAAWLDSHKYYPSMLRRRGIEGEGKLRIEITRAGKLVGIEVARAFSHPSLESIAEDWVKRSEPFPPMPESIPGASYTFVVPVVFRLE